MAEKNISFGYLLPTREIVMSQSVPDCQQIIRLAERAESLGFDSVWVGDSVLARPRLEPLTTLASVASRTRRVRLGTAVLLSALRHPVVLANELANLDLLANGRLILGLGIATKNSAVEKEFAACGVDFRHRIGIFEEGVTIMKRLWEEPEVTFRGRYFDLSGLRLGLRPMQRPGIPIWLAGSVDNAFQRVLRLADGWFPLPSSPESFAHSWQRIEALGKEMGRATHDLARAVYTTVNVNDDVAQADKEVRAFMEGYYGVPYESMAAIQPPCAGPATRCIEWLQAFAERGAETICVRFGSPDQAGQLERFAAEVLPTLHLG
jgi:probable F420-dependent oxidoreductase